MLNTIVAESSAQFADELERAEDFDTALTRSSSAIIREHKRIIFNGNGYADEWVVEATRRGLPNLRTTVDAVPE